MDSEHLRIALYNTAYQLPLIVICIICLAVLGSRWREVGDGATWAALGFGLAIVLGIVAPFVQAVAVDWAKQNGHPITTVASGTALLLSFLRGVSYLFLLAGVLTWRETASRYPPPPSPPGEYR